LLDRWQAATGSIIYDGIGSSEALHIYASNRPGDFKTGTSGRPVPGYELRVVDSEGNDTADGAPGELWVRGGSVARCYWNKPEKNTKSWKEDWFRSGDTFYRDSDGHLHFCGRDDDMLKVGGIWVSPFEIESMLASHPAVLEVAVVGAPDEHSLIKPKAYCVLRHGESSSSLLGEQLIEFAKSQLAPFKYPRWIVFLDELPKTASGKIQRFRLRA
jgi:acyl-coenzyme A synthetase/AMP-(fatty) acid ligase